MSKSLIIFGILFLVLGAVLYFVPMQEFKAATTTTEDGDVDSRTSSANITIPPAYAYASAIIGVILLTLGFVIHTSDKRRDSQNSYDTVVASKENVVFDNGNQRKTTKEITKRHSSKGNKNRR